MLACGTAFQSSEGLYFSHAIATGTKRSKTAALASSIITNNNGSIAGKVRYRVWKPYLNKIGYT